MANVDRTDALERWNVGDAAEWDDAIQTEDDVRDALAAQAEDAGWDVSDEQRFGRDVRYVHEWLVAERQAVNA